MATYNYGSPITGTLTATTAVVNIPFNVDTASVVLNSADVSRAIQLSFDNGLSYYAAVTPTFTASGQLVYTLPFPVTTIKFTGAVDDTYAILP